MRGGQERVEETGERTVKSHAAQLRPTGFTFSGIWWRCRSFEASPDPSRFVRVHWSAIINLDHFDFAEPAGGGRMIARMSTGPDVQVSRAGATALKGSSPESAH